MLSCVCVCVLCVCRQNEENVSDGCFKRGVSLKITKSNPEFCSPETIKAHDIFSPSWDLELTLGWCHQASRGWNSPAEMDLKHVIISISGWILDDYNVGFGWTTPLIHPSNKEKCFNFDLFQIVMCSCNGLPAAWSFLSLTSFLLTIGPTVAHAFSPPCHMHFDVGPFCLCHYWSGSRGSKSPCFAGCQVQLAELPALNSANLFPLKSYNPGSPSKEWENNHSDVQVGLVSINHFLTGANPNHWAALPVILEPRGLLSKSFVQQSRSSDNHIFFKSFVFFVRVWHKLSTFVSRLLWMWVSCSTAEIQPQWAVHCHSLGVADSHTDPFIPLLKQEVSLSKQEENSHRHHIACEKGQFTGLLDLHISIQSHLQKRRTVDSFLTSFVIHPPQKWICSDGK